MYPMTGKKKSFKFCQETDFNGREEKKKFLNFCSNVENLYSTLTRFVLFPNCNAGICHNTVVRDIILNQGCPNFLERGPQHWLNCM